MSTEEINELLGTVQEVCLEEYPNPDSPTFYIIEGLIHSYPIDDVIRSISHLYSFAIANNDLSDNMLPSIGKNGCYGVIGKTEYNGCTTIQMVYLTSDITTNILDKYMNKYGYIYTNRHPYNDKLTSVTYEKKFDNDVTQLLQHVDKLYHICSKEVADKACRIGLTPHETKGIKFHSDDERVYLSFNEYDGISFRRAANQRKMEKGQSLNKEYALIEVDTQPLIKMGMKFYVDPRMLNAIYTHESIPAKCLKIIDTDKIKDTKNE